MAKQMEKTYIPEENSEIFISSPHSFGDLCGGELRCVVWWRFGQAKMEDGFSKFVLTHSYGELCGGELRCVVWWRIGQAKMEEGGLWRWAFVWVLSSFSVLFSKGLFRSLFSVLERDLSGLSMWQKSIGWRKTQVLCHSLIECFLDQYIYFLKSFLFIWAAQFSFWEIKFLMPKH